LAVAVSGAFPAVAEPAGSPAISWTQLGLSDALELLGANQPHEVRVPLPVGVTPTVVTGFIGAAIDVTNGRVDVVDIRGVVLGSIPVPDTATTPFAVNIAAAKHGDDAVTLRFVLRDADRQANGCVRPPSASLSQMAIGFAGEAPNPVTVADFLPGYVDRIVVRVGPRPSADQQQAALDLVANLTRLYRPIPVRVDVDTSSGPALPSTPSQRVVEIREGDRAGLNVENPGSPGALLAITGRGVQLQQQVQLFTDRRVSLAQGQSAAVRSVAESGLVATHVKTFSQLGMSGELSVSGTGTLYTGFDAATFGVASIESAKVHLVARYTPVIDGVGSVVLRSGGTVLASHRLDESGVVDISGEIPAEAITSTVGLAAEIRYVPRQQCAPPSDRITFTIDPTSTVTVQPGTGNRGGFVALPMGFTPDFDVAVDTPEHLRFAAAAVNLIGQQTSVLLRPRMIPLDAVSTSTAGLLLVAPGATLSDNGLRAPLLGGAATSVAINAAPATDVDLNGPLGVVQAFTQDNRIVLAVNATADGWELVDDCFDYIREQDGRWASLNGDVVATGMSGKSVNLTLREGGALLNEQPGASWRGWVVASAVAAATVLIGSAGFAIFRRRRHVRR
jgi:hypothetical protein